MGDDNAIFDTDLNIACFFLLIIIGNAKHQNRCDHSNGGKTRKILQSVKNSDLEVMCVSFGNFVNV